MFNLIQFSKNDTFYIYGTSWWKQWGVHPIGMGVS